MSYPLKRDARGRYHTAYSTCQQCGGQYMLRDMHEQGPRHREWERGEMEVEVPPQPEPRAYSELPDRIRFGESAPCPRCKGRIKKSYMKDRIRHDLPPEQWYAADPDKPSKPCARCNGKGLVPNVAV